VFPFRRRKSPTCGALYLIALWRGPLDRRRGEDANYTGPERRSPELPGGKAALDRLPDQGRIEHLRKAS
jgi:hypothetical protein